MPYLLLPFSYTNEHLSSLNPPYPECQEAIQQEIEHTSYSGIVFCGIPAELPIKVERGGGYDDCTIAHT